MVLSHSYLSPSFPGQEPPDEDEFWCCSVNQDKTHNACEAPQEEGLVPPSEFKTKDPVLLHIKDVVNKRTRKTPLVTVCASVQQSSSDTSNKRNDIQDHESPEKRTRLSL